MYHSKDKIIYFIYSMQDIQYIEGTIEKILHEKIYQNR